MAEAGTNDIARARVMQWTTAALFAALAQLACAADDPPGAIALEPGRASPSGAPACGNGIIDPGEACDEGEAQNATPCGCQRDCQFAEAGKECSDGNVCNGAETCSGNGACVSGRALDCNDLTGATADTCSPSHGCLHLALAGASSTEVRGGDNASRFDSCLPGHVMVGVLATGGDVVSQLRVVCDALNLDGDLTVLLSPGPVMPAHGDVDSVLGARLCPANQVVVGFGGRAGDALDQLIIRCAPVAVSASAGTIPTVTVGTVTSLPAVGGEGGEAFPETDCAPGAVAVGAAIGASDHILSFHLACGKPTIASY